MALREKKVEFWDKVSEINDNPPSVIFNSYPWAKDKPVLVVYEGTLESTQRVEKVSTIRTILGLEPTATDEEVRVALYNDVNKDWLAEQAAANETPVE